MTPEQAKALVAAGAMTPDQYALAVGQPAPDAMPPQPSPPMGMSPAQGIGATPAQPPAPQPGLLSRAGTWLGQHGGQALGTALLPGVGSLVGSGLDAHGKEAAKAYMGAINGPAPELPASPGNGRPLLTPQPGGGSGPGPGGAPGAANAQPGAPDPLQPLLSAHLGGGAAGPAHAAGYSPADRNMLGSLNEQGRYAMDTEAEAQRQLAEQRKNAQDASTALAAQSQQGLSEWQQKQRENDAHRAQIDADSKAAQQRIQAQISELSAQGIDPNRYFQNQSTGQKILGAVAVGLGAFAAHGLGPNAHESTNAALEIMNGAIARDVDAQKANLQKSISVLGSRMNLEAQGFDRQKALLEAERDSYQSGYTVASNAVSRQAALNKDNTEYQQRATELQAGLAGHLQEKIKPLNEQIYSIQKGAERVVGGAGAAGTDVAKAIRERTKEIRDKAADHGKDISVEEAHRQALQEYAGVDVKAGQPVASYAAEPKAGAGAAGKLSPRLAAKAAMLEAHEGELTELIKLLQNGSALSLDQRQQSIALATGLRNDGYTSIPANPLEVWSNSGARVAGAEQVRKDIKAQKEALLKYGSGAAEAGADSPENLGLTKADE